MWTAWWLSRAVGKEMHRLLEGDGSSQASSLRSPSPGRTGTDRAAGGGRGAWAREVSAVCVVTWAREAVHSGGCEGLLCSSVPLAGPWEMESAGNNLGFWAQAAELGP